MLKAAVIGASGYTGVELLRILWGHPQFEVSVATANQYAGEPVGSLYPSLAIQYPGKFEKYHIELLEGCDIAFSGLPHGESMKVVAEAASLGIKVVDLSADFRLTASEYAEWYEVEHSAADLLEGAAYGLPELYRDSIAGAKVVANPGCYPTATLLGLAPLAEAGYLEGTVIIDAKSGISGAGRKATLGTHFPQAADGISPYAVGGHRHLPEIWGRLEELSDEKLNVVFTPHLVPMNRGILSTMYIDLAESGSADEIHELIEDAYREEPFVHVLPQGSYPQTKAVQGSNNCHIAIDVARGGRTLVVTSAIDNLVKGASGQAVQNANLVCGLDETAGLAGPGLFP
ncbi:MAG: N-acetyl-gamma-glutamyl-phosphate reductase [Candidatus Geothermincolia bacterium]